MPYCYKCGFEVGAWMSFCPRCGVSLAPSASQPPRIGYRVTFLSIPLTLLWVLLAILWMQTLSFTSHVSLDSQVIGVISGIAVGFFVGSVATLKQLNSLTQKGETRVTLSTFLFITGGVIVLLALFFIATMILSLPLAAQVGWFDFAYSAGSAILIVRAFLLVEWERNHRMHLYQAMWSNKIYAVPKPDSQR